MNKIGVFSVFDSKANAYLQPFFSQSIGVAERSFSDAVGTPDHQFCKHAADYTLFQIADYNELTGIITPLDKFINIGNGVEFLKSTS